MNVAQDDVAAVLQTVREACDLPDLRYRCVGTGLHMAHAHILSISLVGSIAATQLAEQGCAPLHCMCASAMLWQLTSYDNALG
jgi:hypothetical protein